MIQNPQTVWPFWPGCAILVSILLLVPGRIWPILIPAAFATFALFDLEAGVSIKSIAWFLPANTIQVLTSALCLRYSFHDVPRLNSVKAVAKYSFFAVILAPAGAALFSANGIGGNYWEGWKVCFLSEALAFVTLPPVILSWITEGPAWLRKPRAYYLEPAALIVGLVLLSYVIFAEAGRQYSPALLYSLVPFLLWAALRFGSIGVSGATVLISFLTIWGAIHNRGPFADQGSLNGILSLQLFLVFAALPFMFLAALGEERKHAEKAVRESEERLRLAQQAAGIGTFEWNIQSGVNRWTPELEVLYGLPKGSFPGTQEAFAKMVHPEDFPRVEQWIARSMLSGSEKGEWRVIWPNGTVHWLAGRWRVFKNERGEAALVIGINLDITERKQAEQKLRDSQEQLSGIVGSAMDAIIAIDDEQRIVLFNTAAEKVFGCAAGEAIGTSIGRFIPQRFRVEYSAYIRRFGESDATKRAEGTLGTMWATRANGQEFPIETSISCIEADGRKLFTVILRDITERKQAEQLLREGEERFRLVANTAPVKIWMSGTDKLSTYFNQRWLEFTGRPLEKELGNGWAEGVHPEDLNRCMQTYTEAFDRRESFQMEYRLRRHDGQYRWLSAIGVPRFNPDHSFAGYIGSATDVTERKLAEESLADIGRKLIEAHEEERTWIARELHDDVNQRIALLAIELDQWNQEFPPSAVDFHDHIDHASQCLSEIAADVQALSHRLHSSKLEHLGLVAAARSFCEELSEQRKVEIDFSHTAIPRSVPKEISLCLFRVLQETLQNAVKHSGVGHFKVELDGTEAEIELTVSDLGVGFDPREAMYGRGLGLISMRERMLLVRGELSIKSRPGCGTTIHARVPFDSSRESVRATG